ncbi:hypothetical protein [Pontivivens insulae]|uniref:Uncharacterized protein n=1 Tax=Pontivivens insulae TaxID=1639689 RepID=A0A2R8AG78_9RHOB|nr:hypothetical protein [Pontivivens insulae]RED10688.1 hypothetical protein DFR53_3507 [Pontivivens insulae]SPF31098.1 hypothetical protein POI8812_03449 [Pontivivens insulae]
MSSEQQAENRVWWFEGFWNEAKCQAPISAGADYGGKPVYNQGTLSQELREREIKFTKEHGLYCLFVSRPSTRADRDFDDLGPMSMTGILVSGSMIDLLRDFDLGDSQVLELPMYEGLGKQLGPSGSLKEPDLSHPVPGRWGLLHVLERKDAILEECSVGVGKGLDAPSLDYQPLYVPSRSPETVIGLNSKVSLSGPDIWLDTRLDDVHFISERLRRAILDAGLRVPMMKWLKEAPLHEPNAGEG